MEGLICLHSLQTFQTTNHDLSAFFLMKKMLEGESTEKYHPVLWQYTHYYRFRYVCMDDVSHTIMKLVCNT